MMLLKFIANIENNDCNNTNISLSYDLDESLDIQKAYIYGKESEDLVSKMNDSSIELNDLELLSGKKISIVVEAKVDGRNTEKITNTIKAYENNTENSYSKAYHLMLVN